MKKAVLYARVSSLTQEKEGFSIPAQIKLLQEYAHKSDFIISHEFTDAETAKKAGRSQFKAMLDTIKTDKNIKAILVEKTDRLTRNFHDYVIVDELIAERDIEVHMVKEGEVLSKHAKSHTKMVHGLKVLLAKNFIDNLGEEIAKGMKEKAEQGHWPSRAPYGYKNNRETRLIETHPDQSLYVKSAFEHYASGAYSLKGVVNKLYEMGFRFRPSTAKPSLSNIHHILTNPIYSGRFTFRGHAYIGKHEPLVSASMFNEVQRNLKIAGKCDYEKRSIAFQGLIKCGHCGGTVTGDIKKKKYIYYRCGHHKQKCPDKYIREEALVEQFRKAVASISMNPEQVAWIKQALKEVNGVKEYEIEERREYIQKEIARLETRLNKLYEDKLDGIISGEFYMMKANEYNGQISELNGSWSQLSMANKDQMRLGMAILDLATHTVKAFDAMDNFDRADLLRILVSNFSLKDGNASPVWKKPFDVLAEKPQNNKKYSQGDSNPCRIRERDVS
jgi:site-specific DNA recombinase